MHEKRHILVLLTGLVLACGSLAVSQTSPPAPTPLRLGEAVLMALQNNRNLEVQRLEPRIRRTFEEEERAAFDPRLAGELLAVERTTLNRRSEDLDQGQATTRRGAAFALEGDLPTGTRIAAGLNGFKETGDTRLPPYGAEGSVSLSQALLQGRPPAVNLASLRQARLDTKMSEHEFQGFAEALVADVEMNYWACALARRRVRIFEEALLVAEQQLREMDHRIRVGSLPEVERVSAQAETALRREALINARSALALADLGLLRLIQPAALSGPRTELIPVTEPAAVDAGLESLDTHVRTALIRRPELKEARLLIERDDLELVKTRNGLLPRLDLFVTLGDTGYARSFGGALEKVEGAELDYAAGLRLSFPFLNRQARAAHQRAALSREQAGKALENLADLVRVDVEAAYIEVERAREQIKATRVTRQFQEEKFRAEQAKFNVGRSTGLLVAQAQKDLIDSQVAEVDSVISSLRSLVRLFRLEGTLLERRGLTMEP